jgi:hypothetical protein
VWTDITRRQYARAELLLPSDLTDAEWAILEPLLPPRSKLGRPPVWDYRQIVEAILYLLRGGLPWRMLPPRAISAYDHGAALFLPLERDGCVEVNQPGPAADGA